MLAILITALGMSATPPPVIPKLPPFPAAIVREIDGVMAQAEQESLGSDSYVGRKMESGKRAAEQSNVTGRKTAPGQRQSQQSRNNGNAQSDRGNYSAPGENNGSVMPLPELDGPSVDFGNGFDATDSELRVQIANDIVRLFEDIDRYLSSRHQREWNGRMTARREGNGQAEAVQNGNGNGQRRDGREGSSRNGSRNGEWQEQRTAREGSSVGSYNG